MLHEISPCVVSVSVMTSLVMTSLVIDFAPNYSGNLLTTYLASHLVILFLITSPVQKIRSPVIMASQIIIFNITLSRAVHCIHGAVHPFRHNLHALYQNDSFYSVQARYNDRICISLRKISARFFYQ
jgi:hypothetical protein